MEGFRYFVSMINVFVLPSVIEWFFYTLAGSKVMNYFESKPIIVNQEKIYKSNYIYTIQATGWSSTPGVRKANEQLLKINFPFMETTLK